MSSKGYTKAKRFYQEKIRGKWRGGEVIEVGKLKSAMRGTHRNFGPTVIKIARPSKTKRTIDRLIITSHNAYLDYNKQNRGTLQNRTEYSQIVRAIYESISDLAISSPNGVFLEELGYLVPTASIIEGERPSRDKSWKFGEGFYLMTLFTDTTKKSVIKGMTMDKMFSQPTRRNLHEKLFTGHKPKNYYSILKYLYNPKQINRHPL